MNYSISALKQIMKPEGFNIGINIGKVAGAGVPDHIHIHLVPRWLGDTNFLPVLTDTKIINQALKDTKQKLKKIIKSIVK
ncbi:MAG: HIT family hydrolase, partial [candidate division WOR-3 bacterium]